MMAVREPPFERKVLDVQQLDWPAAVVKADFEALRREDDPAVRDALAVPMVMVLSDLTVSTRSMRLRRFFPAERLARTLACAVAFDEVLLLFDELLLAHVLGLLPPLPLGLEVAVLAVVALVRGELAVVDLHISVAT